MATLAGCGASAEQLAALGDKIAAETDSLLAQFEGVKDVSSAETALPKMLETYDQLVADAQSLQSTAEKNLGRGFTPELQEKLKTKQETFAKRFQTHRKKISRDLKLMQTLAPLFKKIDSNPFSF